MESRLLKLNNLIREKCDIHYLIRSNLRLNVAPYEQKFTNKYNKQVIRTTGRLVSQYISKIKNKKIGLDGEIEYLNTIRSQLSSEVAYRIEPRLKYIEDQFKHGHWIKIDYASYIIGLEAVYSNFSQYNILHNLHESTADPLLVAYYPTIDHMRKGREVRTKLGKYLKTYQIEFGLSDAQIKGIVENHNTMIEARAGWTVKFIGSNDPQGWFNVYANCTHRSCMSDRKGDADEWIKQYAHDQSVLRLAFIQSGENIVARCIVREDLKEWIRVYPEPNGYTEGNFLKSYLQNMGYKHGTLIDTLITTRPHSEGGYVAPYIDRGSNGDYPQGEIVEMNGQLYIRIVDNGDFDLTYTNGRTEEEEEEYHCECCDGYFNEDDMDGDICLDCVDEYTSARSCNGTDAWINNNDVIWVGDYAYDPDYLEDNNIYYDEYNGEYYHLDDLVSTSRGMVHHHDCILLDHEDSEGNSHAVNDDSHELSDGTICHTDDAESLEAELQKSEATSE